MKFRSDWHLVFLFSKSGNLPQFQSRPRESGLGASCVFLGDAVFKFNLLKAQLIHHSKCTHPTSLFLSLLPRRAVPRVRTYLISLMRLFPILSLWLCFSDPEFNSTWGVLTKVWQWPQNGAGCYIWPLIHAFTNDKLPEDGHRHGREGRGGEKEEMLVWMWVCVCVCGVWKNQAETWENKSRVHFAFKKMSGFQSQTGQGLSLFLRNLRFQDSQYFVLFQTHKKKPS